MGFGELNRLLAYLGIIESDSTGGVQGAGGCGSDPPPLRPAR